MIVGLLVAVYYIFRMEMDSISWIGVSGLRMTPWFHVNSTSAGVFGVAAGFVTIILVSLFTGEPKDEGTSFLDALRRTKVHGETFEGDSYWLQTRRLTFSLLLVWVAVIFGLSWFADELNSSSLFGFPLGFYMAAQGSLFIFLGLIWFYNRKMRKVDGELGIADE
jgi:putative solute:sodium symporter small subunit